MRAQNHRTAVEIEAAVPRIFGFVMLGVTVTAVVLLLLAMWLYAG